VEIKLGKVGDLKSNLFKRLATATVEQSSYCCWFWSVEIKLGKVGGACTVQPRGWCMYSATSRVVHVQCNLAAKIPAMTCHQHLRLSPSMPLLLVQG
jgi:hypothetical protein